MSTTQPLDPRQLPLAGTQLIEASAGTGKTWTIAALYLRLVLGHGGGVPLLPSQILVMTFTNTATAELRERIRTRLAEAAEAFRGHLAPDDYLATLIADYPDADARARAARQLELAAQWMDEAAVFTIHGWCQRMLTQHAFASGEGASDATRGDDSAQLADATRDYWRCHVFPLAPEIAVHYAALWPQPAALQAAVKSLLPHAGQLEIAGWAVVDAAPPATALQAPVAALGPARDAACAIWRRDRGEVMARFDQAIATRALSLTKYKSAMLAQDAAAFDRWAGGADAPDAHTIQRFTTRGLADALLKNKTAPTHAFIDAIDNYQGILDEIAALKPALLAHAVPWIAGQCDATRRRLRQLSFDDMLVRLDAALDGAKGDALAGLITAQYPVALVDEFQDTDPLQWRILERLYVDQPGKALLLIGDPKQAIYGFRGADIHTYLAARARASQPTWTLGTNHRSTAALVAAVNHVFAFAGQREQGAFGFGAQLPFHSVEASGRHERLVLDGAPLPAMQIVVDASATLSKVDWRTVMADDAAEQIVHWLNAAGEGRCGFVDAQGVLAPLRPSDVAILVRDKDDAAAMGVALHRRGLAYAYLSDRHSVYASSEAGQLVAWLTACARPGDDRAMRAALATPAMGQSLAELARLDTDEAWWDACGEHFRALHALWQRHGVLAMLHELLHRFDVPARLLARDGGERALTNLLHLAELLQHAAIMLDGEAALIRHLSAQIAQPGVGEGQDEQIVRLESEAALIKVVTVHKAKGLEYPVVLLPFLGGFREAARDKPLAWHDDDGKPHFDLSPDAAVWQRAEAERRQEDLRLLYVALTRARHLCRFGAACLKDGTRKASALHKTALGYVLGAQPAPDATDLAPLVAALAKGCADIVITAPIGNGDPTPCRTLAATGQPRRTRQCTLPPREPWWIASYSALAQHDASTAPPAPETAGESTLAESVLAALATTVAEAPAAADEAGVGAMIRDVAPEAPAAADEAPAPPNAPTGIHAFERGAAAGTFLHELLEHCAHEGFAAAAAPSPALLATIARRCQARGWKRWITTLGSWVPHFLHTPLALPGGGTMALTALADPKCYRAELEFWFAANHVQAQALDQLVTAHTLGGAPRAALAPNLVNGMLKGFIDLAFEHAGRWYVADYKSNWLGPDADAYTPPAMRASVLGSRYDLQYAIYTLALHRQLKARLPGYDYERDMGGVLYLYLRGVDGRNHGVHVDRLPFALVDGMDQLFAHGEHHARP